MEETFPTVRGNRQYLQFKTKKTNSRRKDLMNPALYLDDCLENGAAGFRPGSGCFCNNEAKRRWSRRFG